MSINEDTSFIEYNVEQPTQDFVTNFDIIGGTTDVVHVTVDGVLTDTPESSYTVQQMNHNTWRITPEVQIGSVVRLYRVTNIDDMMHVFTAGAKFIARNMDNNFKQIRHSQQELYDDFSSLDANTTLRLDTFSDRVDALNTEFLTTQDVVADLITVSADTVNTANTAFNIANAIGDKADTALSNSSTALNTANGIDAKAELALTNAASAVNTANAAETTANGIAGTAMDAVVIAEGAKLTAGIAEGVANDALQVAQDALDQTALQPATSTTLGGIKVGSEFTMSSDSTLELSGTVTRDLQVNGGIVATGNITAFSDIRLKYDINYVDDALDKVCSLNGVTFKRVYDHRPSVGLIAQDVQRVLPEAVIQHGEYLTVDYLGVIGLLVEAIKDLEYKVKLLGG